MLNLGYKDIFDLKRILNLPDDFEVDDDKLREWFKSVTKHSHDLDEIKEIVIEEGLIPSDIFDHSLLCEWAENNYIEY